MKFKPLLFFTQLVGSIVLMSGPLAISVSAQETRYVSDVIFVPLRSGQGNEYRIINASLKSGMALTLLEEPAGSEWSRVRTPNGTEGWIPNQYLMADIPARIQLAQAQAKIAVLTTENDGLKQQTSQLKTDNSTLTKKAEEEVSSRTQMQNELQRVNAISADAVDLDRRYRDLLEKHQLIQTELDSMRAENEKLVNDQRINFLIYGAGILIFGMIFATILPSLRMKKRYSEWA